MKPKISVVIPVYNSEKYLKASIKSILRQSFRNFEVISVDDGSVDKTPQILRSIKDKRLKVLKNKKNMGVARSLNIGLKKARGEYIARCDGDDINNLDRFKKQVNFLDKNKDFVLVGSQFEIINKKNKKIGVSHLPETDSEIRRKMIIRNPISHPSVMYRRKEVLKMGGYREFFNGAEDYDLWFRFFKYGKLQNLSDKLVKRRWHEEVVTKKNHIKVEVLALVVRLINFPAVLRFL